VAPTDPLQTPTASCSGVVRIYPSASGEAHALRGVDAQFVTGTVTALTGPSGSGKSTLLSILGLRDRPNGGEVRIQGRAASSFDARARRSLGRRTIAWLPQRPTDGLYLHLTAEANLEQAARWRGVRDADLTRTLGRLGLADVAHVPAARLSGGEQQRVALACACVGRPALVLCDEPTAELDEETAALALAELRVAAESGSAVVVATHDQAAIAASDREVALRHGVLATERWVGGGARAPIDPAGRIQLPREALDLFPDQRAVVRVEDGRVVLEPTHAPTDPGTEQP
jgi:putative ABC transport system ATP-binding protein